MSSDKDGKHVADKAADKSADNENSESEWGFEDEKKGMAIETKCGLALILVLVCAFSFVVYRKMDKQKGIHQTAGTNNETVTPNAGQNDPFADPVPPLDDHGYHAEHHHEGSPFHEQSHDHASHTQASIDVSQFHTEVTGASTSNPFRSSDQQHKQSGFDNGHIQHTSQNALDHGSHAHAESDPFRSESAFETPEPNQSHYQTPQDHPQTFESPEPQTFDDNPFPNDVAQHADHGHQHNQAEQTPFDSDPAIEPEQNHNPHGSAEIQDLGDLTNPFADTDAQQNTTAQQVPETVPQQSEPQEFGGFFDEPAAQQPEATSHGSYSRSNDSSATFPANAGTFESNHDDSHGHSSASQNPLGQPAQEAAPVDPNPFPAEPTYANQSQQPQYPIGSATPLHAAADIYVVQRNDSFWSISKKQYGTARYHKSLAEHNKQWLGKYKKIRPGMKLETPHAHILETRYSHLIARRTGSGHSQGVGGSVPIGPRQPAGFFRDDHGHPMYSVGKRDTLTGIAQKHLGRASRWREIYRQNRDRLANPNSLKIGTILRLPYDASRVQLVRGGPGLR